MGDTREDMEHEENTAAAGQETEFEQLYNQSLKRFKAGTLVRARVLQIRSGVVMVDLGYKSDGIIPLEQFTEEELKVLKPGDEIEVLLEAAEDTNGNIMLSRDKAKKLQVWDDLNRAYQSGTPVSGKVRNRAAAPDRASKGYATRGRKYALRLSVPNAFSGWRHS